MNRESEGFFEEVFECGGCEVDALKFEVKAFEDAFEFTELESVDGAFSKVQPYRDSVEHGLVLGEECLEIAQDRGKRGFFVKQDLKRTGASFDVDGGLLISGCAAKGCFGGFAFKQHQLPRWGWALGLLFGVVCVVLVRRIGCLGMGASSGSSQALRMG